MHVCRRAQAVLQSKRGGGSASARAKDEDPDDATVQCPEVSLLFGPPGLDPAHGEEDRKGKHCKALKVFRKSASKICKW
jgi:hypothetical protein